ncbi:MAG: LysR family transcriptional regulator [Clostridium sp.]|nr:LysR family transcriptional regulator [Acetatifactor muris]MCM1562688.1 LysR family transcriptional regulator [Clostridium sp.]
MTLSQLVYAVTVAEQKSMNKAAAELFVSQPALSGAIRDLENELHTQIFGRSNKGIAITAEGEEFLSYARQIVEISQMIGERYTEDKSRKKKFSVSMQHYSFAVEAFIELGQKFSMNEFELAVYETRTYEVIGNVRDGRSEIGVLYLNDFNGKALNKIIADNGLEFVPLFDCGISVYLSKKHPLADRAKIRFEELEPYPCLSFEQGDKNAFYFAEEVLSTLNYKQIIKANDRATMLNLMVGLNGYTLCSGIICGDLNGGNFVSVPFDTSDHMTIGYVRRKNMPLSVIGQEYIQILKKYETVS